MTEPRTARPAARSQPAPQDRGARSADRETRVQERLEREARGRRALFVTSLAGFVVFFGMTASGNPVVPEAAPRSTGPAAEFGTIPADATAFRPGSEDDVLMPALDTGGGDAAIRSPVQIVSAPKQPRARRLRTRAS